MHVRSSPQFVQRDNKQEKSTRAILATLLDPQLSSTDSCTFQSPELNMDLPSVKAKLEDRLRPSMSLGTRGAHAQVRLSASRFRCRAFYVNLQARLASVTEKGQAAQGAARRVSLSAPAGNRVPELSISPIFPARFLSARRVDNNGVSIAYRAGLTRDYQSVKTARTQSDTSALYGPVSIY